MDLITPGDVLGMSWSRTLSGLAAALTQIPPCPIVQLTGAVPPPDGRDLLDLVRSVARIGGGPAHVFYAPMILDDAQTAAAIRRQARHRRRLRAGAVGDDGGGRHRRLGARAVHHLRRGHAGRSGTRWPRWGCAPNWPGCSSARTAGRCATPLDSRMIVTPGPALEQIPFVLSVAYGVSKSPAVCAAIRGEIVHGLVTHASLARALLSQARPVPGGA